MNTEQDTGTASAAQKDNSIGIFVTTHRDLNLHDASDGDPETVKKFLLAPGTYELERIPCPLPYNCNWLVRKGTKIGMSQGAWTDLIDLSGDSKIELIENGKSMIGT